MGYHVVIVAEKTLRRNCGNPLQFDMPCLRQSQVPALFAGVKSSWIRGFAVPTCPGLRRFAKLFANVRKPELVGTCANPKIKDAFHTFKTNNAGGTPGRKIDFVKIL